MGNRNASHSFVHHPGEACPERLQGSRRGRDPAGALEGEVEIPAFAGMTIQPA
jgi:hypothetical protein